MDEPQGAPKEHSAWAIKTVVAELGIRGPGSFGAEARHFLDHEEFLQKAGASRTLEQAASPFCAAPVGCQGDPGKPGAPVFQSCLHISGSVSLTRTTKAATTSVSTAPGSRTTRPSSSAVTITTRSSNTAATRRSSRRSCRQTSHLALRATCTSEYQPPFPTPLATAHPFSGDSPEARRLQTQGGRPRRNFAKTDLLFELYSSHLRNGHRVPTWPPARPAVEVGWGQVWDAWKSPELFGVFFFFIQFVFNNVGKSIDAETDLWGDS